MVFQSLARRPGSAEAIGAAMPPGICTVPKPPPPPRRPRHAAPAAAGRQRSPVAAGGGGATRTCPPPAGAQPFARGLDALGVDRDPVRVEIAVSERDVDPFHPAVRGLLRAQQHAGLAPLRAAERREKAHVLIRAIQDEPAGARFRAAGDLAVRGSPLGWPQRVPPGERRALEHDIGQEILGPFSTDGPQEPWRRRRAPRPGRRNAWTVSPCESPLRCSGPAVSCGDLYLGDP